MIEVRLDTALLVQRLTQLGVSLLRAPEMQDARKGVGVKALHDIKLLFDQRSVPGGPWPKLSAVTVVLRPGDRLYSAQDITQAVATAFKLRSKGALLKSLAFGAPHNITEISEVLIKVGTTAPGAATHQDGGMSDTFIFDEAKKRRFDERVSKVAQGRRVPKKLPPGHKYRWNQRKEGQRGIWHLKKAASPWNPSYFILWNYMRKISGSKRLVPRRRFIEPPPPMAMRVYAQMLEKGAEAVARRLGF
jgi:hypothetical protein